MNIKTTFYVLLLVLFPSSSFATKFVNVFNNITVESGLDGVPAYRISIADVNGDGYPDLLLHKAADEVKGDVLNKQYLYLNVSANDPTDPLRRTFVDFTTESGIRANRRGTAEGRHSSFAVFADVDNDGDLDMFSGVYVHRPEEYTDIGDRNDLLLNDGAGHFTLTTDTTLHDDGILNTSSATFLDYDRDGNIDLFIGNWWRSYPASKSYMDQLYKGNGDGSFINVTDAAGLDVEQPTYSVSAADVNNDGLMDLFAPNYCRGQSIHWQNNGDGTFTQVQTSTNYGQYIGVPGALLPPPYYSYKTCSWGSMPRDFDNDGDIDFFEIITHGSENGNGIHSTVLVNENNFFTWDFDAFDRTAQDPPSSVISIPDVTDRYPTHHGDHYATWIDIDNDGLSSVILSECCYYDNNSLYVFNPSGDGDFTLTATPLLWSLTHNNGRVHNVSSFDYDLDGDDDLIVGFASNDGLQLWRNEIGSHNNWIRVGLTGAGSPIGSNTSAIGARVEVTVGEKTFTREVYAGNGHFGPQEPLDLTFGLGAAKKVDKITVYWPNKNQTFTELHNININQFVAVKEELPVPVESIKILSDNTWKSYNTLQAGWEITGFNDSSWRNANAPYPYRSDYSPEKWMPGTNAVYMWDWPDAGTPSGKNGPVETWYRKTFNISADTSSIVNATAVVAADDDFDFYVNGIKVLSDWDGTVWSAPFSADIKSYLVRGKNTFAMHAKDSYGTWEWALVDITIEVEIIEGDLNNDSCVDRGDLSVILAEIRSPTPHDASYDLNGDGEVNIADARKLVLLFSNSRGKSCD